MYTFTLIIFALPISLISAAWYSRLKPLNPNAPEPPRKYPPWRQHCELAALILATAATVFNLISWFSWFHNGGSPHGMCPPLGLWKPTGRAAFFALLAAILLTVFATGKRRWLVAACTATLVLGEFMISMAEMD